jgi:hypothetical protein
VHAEDDDRGSRASCGIAPRRFDAVQKRSARVTRGHTGEELRLRLQSKLASFSFLANSLLSTTSGGVPQKRHGDVHEDHVRIALLRQAHRLKSRRDVKSTWPLTRKMFAYVRDPATSGGSTSDVSDVFGRVFRSLTRDENSKVFLLSGDDSQHASHSSVWMT